MEQTLRILDVESGDEVQRCTGATLCPVTLAAALAVASDAPFDVDG